MFLKAIKKIFPKSLKILIKKYYYQNKYDVLFYKNASASNTQFEGKNILRNNVNLSNVLCGFGTTISENTTLSKAKIGKYCSIGQYVKNAIGMHPSKVFVSSYPGFYAPSSKRLSFTNTFLFEKHKYIDSKKQYHITIGNDVWIGNNVTIFDGIAIGNGAIIATGAIITKNVEPYAIVGGIPGKLIRYRFSEEQISFLQKFKWWDKDILWLKKNAYLFTNIENFIKVFAKKT